jgi:hypothetical protein
MMKRLAVPLLVLACLAPAALQKRKQQSQNQVEVMEAKAERQERSIMLDGRVKNTGQRVLYRLTLVFDLIDSEQKVIASRKGPIEEDVLEPGEEATFQFHVPDQARAVQFRMGAESKKTVDLEVIKPGPFLIE